MRFQTPRLTLTALLVLCIAGALALSHGPSAAADTFGLTVAENSESTSSSGDDTPKPGKLPARAAAPESTDLHRTGVPGTPVRVLQLRHRLTRFPILPQGPPHRT